VKKAAKNWWDPKGICCTVADGQDGSSALTPAMEKLLQ